MKKEKPRCSLEQPTHYLIRRVKALTKGGNQIDAIKLVRKHTWATLMDALNFVRRYQ